MRLVVVHPPQGLPLAAMPRPVVHEDDEGTGAGALGLQHAIQEVLELALGKGAHLISPRRRSAASFALSRSASMAAGALLTAVRVTSVQISSVISAAVAPPRFLPRSRRCRSGRSVVTTPPSLTLSLRPCT